MSTDKLPKVLIFGHQFDTRTGLGITLANLFFDWPQDKIGILSSNLDIRECEAAKPCCMYIGKANVHTINQAKYNNRIRNLIKKIYYKAGMPEIRHRWDFDEVYIQQAKTFDPQIIFCCLGSYGSMLDCERILKELPTAKLVLYIVDDWINTSATNKYLKRLWRRRNDEIFRRLLDKSSGLLSICPAMSEAYLEQYGKTFYPFHNPVDISFWKGLPLSDKKEEISILYTGKINSDTKGCLLDMCSVITKLNAAGHHFSFDVYTPDFNLNDGLFASFPNCHLFPPISHSDIPGITKNHSALFLTLGFSNKTKKYVRLSMPTKLSEYLAAGIPIVLYCPEDIALARYLSGQQCAIQCFKHSISHLRESVLRLEDKELCQKIVSNSMKLAEKHDISAVRARFEKLMAAFSNPELSDE